MIAIGLDVHLVRTTVAWVDTETGEVGEPEVVPTERLAAYLSDWSEATRIVVETSGRGEFVARELKSCGQAVVMVDAFKAHRLFEAMKTAKTDKLDAQALAQLLAVGALAKAEVWVPDPATHELRELTRARKHLTELGVSLRNEIRAFLGRQGVRCPACNLLGRKGRAWLEAYAESLPSALAFALGALYRTLSDLGTQLAALNQAVQEVIQQQEAVALVQTIPGFGPQLAATVVAEIGTIERFATATQLRGYSGLVPRVHQSGEHRHTGPLVKRGNPQLRWAMVLAAQLFARTVRTRDFRLRHWYGQLVFRHGPNPAKVALARRLLNIVFAVLRDRTPFDADRHLLAPAP